MAAAAPTGFSLATEIADFLVRAHIPFSQAHEAAGACVALCEKTTRELHELTDAELLAIHPSLTGGVREVLSVAGALSSRTTAGGTAPTEVAIQLKDLTAKNSQFTKLINSLTADFSGMMSA
jgi:argininosuccinate lyase